MARADGSRARLTTKYSDPALSISQAIDHERSARIDQRAVAPTRRRTQVMGSNVFIKNRIPDGSKVCVSVTAEEGSPEDSFTASARLVPEVGNEQVWPDEEIHPGPKCTKLVRPHVYVIRVAVSFNTTERQKAAIRAVVTKPDGTVFGDTYEFIFSGARNEEPVRATILLATLK
jgi:hypothetical protein